MKLEKRTIEQWIYTSTSGKEMPLAELNRTHLVNAYHRAIIDGEAMAEAVLEGEILRRLKANEQETA